MSYNRGSDNMEFYTNDYNHGSKRSYGSGFNDFNMEKVVTKQQIIEKIEKFNPSDIFGHEKRANNISNKDLKELANIYLPDSVDTSKIPFVSQYVPNVQDLELLKLLKIDFKKNDNFFEVLERNLQKIPTVSNIKQKLNSDQQLVKVMAIENDKFFYCREAISKLKEIQQLQSTSEYLFKVNNHIGNSTTEVVVQLRDLYINEK